MKIFAPISALREDSNFETTEISKQDQSIKLIIFIPSVTFPKTVCFPSNLFINIYKKYIPWAFNGGNKKLTTISIRSSVSHR